MFKLIIKLLEEIKKYKELVKYLHRKLGYNYGRFIECQNKDARRELEIKYEELRTICNVIDELEGKK